MKKQELPTIRTSSEKCVACPKSGFHLKSDGPREFSAPVCVDHLIERLTDWEMEDKAQAKADELRKKQQKEAAKKAKEAASGKST